MVARVRPALIAIPRRICRGFTMPPFVPALAGTAWSRSRCVRDTSSADPLQGDRHVIDVMHERGGRKVRAIAGLLDAEEERRLTDLWVDGHHARQVKQHLPVQPDGDVPCGIGEYFKLVPAANRHRNWTVIYLGCWKSCVPSSVENEIKCVAGIVKIESPERISWRIGDRCLDAPRSPQHEHIVRAEADRCREVVPPRPVEWRACPRERVKLGVALHPRAALSPGH